MKLALWGAAALSVGAASLSWNGTQGGASVILLPDFRGEMTPCGCIKPMSGGLLRLGTAVARLMRKGTNVVLSNGNWIADVGRQDELKAETIAEALKAVGVDAVNLSASEAKLGIAEVAAIQRLLGDDRLITGSLQPGSNASFPPFVEKKPFLVGGVSADPGRLGQLLDTPSVSVTQAVQALVSQARDTDLVPILLFNGAKEEAVALAKANPGLRLIGFTSESEPDPRPTVIGKTWIVSAGSRGKQVLRATLEGREFSKLEIIDLGPSVSESPDVRVVLDRYLSRVTSENLLDKIPRASGGAYAGTATCGSCHAKALKIWSQTAHSHALKTLESDGHGRDPDCVKCHVVGLEFKGGFVSRQQTPALANVGCEACHGPGRAHSQNPTIALPEVDAKTCMRCHNLNHDPGFEFQAYWKRIRH